MSWEAALDEFEARLVELEDAVLSHEQSELPEWQIPEEPLPAHLTQRAEELMARATESIRLGEEERERTMVLINTQSRASELRGRSEASVLDQRA
jgi:hypothetical protein